MAMRVPLAAKAAIAELSRGILLRTGSVEIELPVSMRNCSPVLKSRTKRRLAIPVASVALLATGCRFPSCEGDNRLCYTSGPSCQNGSDTSKVDRLDCSLCRRKSHLCWSDHVMKSGHARKHDHVSWSDFGKQSGREK